MNRIDARFKALAAARRTGLIPFVTAGCPGPAATVPVLHALVAGGADLIEIGVPFSDPMADGPVIQKASEHALAQGVGLTRVLAMVAEFRVSDGDTPIVLMGYLNPVEIYGHARFAADAQRAGVDGVLLVDAPVEEAGEIRAGLAAAGIAQIFLVAPTTRSARLQQVAQAASGFIYYVSFAGITGADHLAVGDVAQHVADLRAQSRIPIAVGFGVKEPAQSAAIGAFADAVVIGSALVERLAHSPSDAAAAEVARAFIAAHRQALDRAAVAAAA